MWYRVVSSTYVSLPRANSCHTLRFTSSVPRRFCHVLFGWYFAFYVRISFPEFDDFQRLIFSFINPNKPCYHDPFSVYKCMYIYIYTCIDRHTVLVVFCGQRSSCHSLVHLFEQHGTPQPWKHRLSFGDALSHHTFKGTTIRAHGLFQPQPHTRRDCYLWWAWWLQDCIRNWHDQSSATRIEINRLTYIV